jgi:hypothetical protein
MRVSIKAPDGNDETAKAMLRDLIQRTFAFKAEWQEIEKDLPVLRFDAAKGNGKFKKSTATKSGGFARHGTMTMTKVRQKAF